MAEPLRHRYVGDRPPVSRQSVTVTPQPRGLLRGSGLYRAGHARYISPAPPGGAFRWVAQFFAGGYVSASQQSVANRKRQWTAWTSPSTHQETATSSNFESEASGAGSSLAHRSFELEIYDDDKTKR
jgi:hypothetical protein